MALDLNKFVTIEKNVGMGRTVFDDTIRVNEKSFAVGLTVIRHLKENIQNNKLYATLQYSPDDNAIRVVAPKTNAEGFALALNDRHTSAMLTSLPAKLRELRVKRGIYTLHPEHDDIYVLNEKFAEENVPSTPLTPEERYKDETFSFEVNDVVSWITALRGNAEGKKVLEVPVTGRITDLYTKDGEQWAKIKPISRVWYMHSHATSTNAKTHKLILREKAMQQ